MIEQVKKTLKYYSMFDPGERVVVGVSGGPDSVCLLHVLKQLNFELCLDIQVAHFDHCLRKSSAADGVFVEKLASSLGVPFFCDRLNWKKTKRLGSLEGLLKKHRYDFLSRVCEKAHSKKMVLGHTQDDQAETVLMRILRGSGLFGLSAILPKRPFGPATIVRPLIEVSRFEVMRYLNKKKLNYRMDDTNLDETFLRNKIRHSLLPLLEEKYNPNIKKVLSGLALNVGADYHFLRARAEIFLKKNLEKKPKGFSIALRPLKKADIAIRRIFLRMVIEMLKGDLSRLTFKHLQEIEELLSLRPVLAQVHLPGNIILSTTLNCLDIFKR